MYYASNQESAIKKPLIATNNAQNSTLLYVMNDYTTWERLLEVRLDCLAKTHDD